MPTKSPTACSRPSTRPTADELNSWPITKHTASLRSKSKKARKTALLANQEETPAASKAPKAYVEPEYNSVAADLVVEYMSRQQLEKSIERTRKLMQDAAKKLEFIQAAQYRDELIKLEDMLKEKAE